VAWVELCRPLRVFCCSVRAFRDVWVEVANRRLGGGDRGGDDALIAPTFSSHPVNLNASRDKSRFGLVIDR